MRIEIKLWRNNTDQAPMATFESDVKDIEEMNNLHQRLQLMVKSNIHVTIEQKAEGNAE